MEKALKEAIKAWEEYDRTGILPEKLTKKKKVLISINGFIFLKFKEKCKKEGIKVSPKIEKLVRMAIAQSQKSQKA
jgi:hypothetical protein